MKPALQTILGIGAVFALSTFGSLGDSQAFEQANKLYEEGRYLEAVESYETLLTNAPTSALHFNLGNAWFKSGQIGEAIAEYLQAQALAPRDPDVRANLNFARSCVDGVSYRPDWLQQKAEALTNRDWIILTTIGIWGFFGLLTAGQLRPNWRTAFRGWKVFLGALAALLLGTTLWVAKSRAETQIAVVVQRETVMRRGPFEESQGALNLKNGAELRVLDHKDGWLKVTPDGRQSGWITNGAAHIIH